MPYLEVPVGYGVCGLIGFALGLLVMWLIERDVREFEKENL
ncbi:MAG: hypothetical protein AM325_015720 [Candidatus Thorarchaeota archaeon SMTZ1-45]